MADNTLLTIQSELKAPKGQYNSFGKYKYRSCEDILEAVKPILKKHGATLVLSDEIKNIGDRYYIEARAILSKDGEVIMTTTALAREPQEKKGMDESQITGTASSYARKYALNGMFLIDDTKDDDTDEQRIEREERQKAQEQPKAITSPPQRKNEPPKADVKPESEMTKPTDKIEPVHVTAVRERIKKSAEKGKVLEEDALCKMLKIKKLEDMNFGQLTWFNQMMEKSGV